MASFNKVILMGNLVRDPETRTTPGGTAICRFTVACSRKFKDKDGQEREDTAFIDVDSFGKQAEVISKFFSKGKPILLEGRLRQDKWDDKKTGEKRSKILVTLESFSFVGSARGSEGGGEGGGSDFEDSSPPERAGNAAPAKRPPPPEAKIDEDVPF